MPNIQDRSGSWNVEFPAASDGEDLGVVVFDNRVNPRQVQLFMVRNLHRLGEMLVPCISAPDKELITAHGYDHVPCSMARLSHNA